MNYITKNIITTEWVEKIQVYKIVGAENIDWNTIETKVFDWEYTREELLLKINNAKQNVISSGDFVTELEAKLWATPTQAEINLVLAEKQKSLDIQRINAETREKILSRYSETDQTNLERKASRIMWVTLYEKRDFTADEAFILKEVMEADDFINLCIAEWKIKINSL